MDGSPQQLTFLHRGSMVTPFKAVAKAFSHKPSIVSIPDGMDSVKHDGEVPGHLYEVAEHLGPDDLVNFQALATLTGSSSATCGWRLSRKSP